MRQKKLKVEMIMGVMIMVVVVVVVQEAVITCGLIIRERSTLQLVRVKQHPTEDAIAVVEADNADSYFNGLLKEILIIFDFDRGCLLLFM